MNDIVNDCVCGGRGCVDDEHEPRERYRTCRAGDRLRMADAHQLLSRTSIVSPLVYFAITKRHETERIPGVLASFRGGLVIADWYIVSDPDCPRDYSWPETVPPEVAAVIRQGIADATLKEGT